MFPAETLWGYLGLMLKAAAPQPTSTMEFGVFAPPSGTQFARNREPTEEQNSGSSGLYAVNCGGKNLSKMCSRLWRQTSPLQCWRQTGIVL